VKRKLVGNQKGMLHQKSNRLLTQPSAYIVYRHTKRKSYNSKVPPTKLKII